MEQKENETGVCPECLSNDGCLNIESNHYCVCHEHRVYWFVGSNLFSSWKSESWMDWIKNNRILNSYKEIQDHQLSRKEAHAKQTSTMVSMVWMQAEDN